ncbi:hypothetical protein HAX54_012101 [Datura stramonium]|uniref:Uncharacterized protein n=1 Tax=Datura stramonium TaxID=4076 RepID=A0ABS8RIH2_DATST|nr:hypothetical protein [Datura stramonium]
MKDKQPQQKKDKRLVKEKQPMNNKQPIKRKKGLIDKEDIEPSPPRFSNDKIVEDFPLTAPQPSQDSASTQSLFGKSFGQSIFGSSLSVPDFEYLGLEVEEDIPWKSRDIGNRPGSIDFTCSTSVLAVKDHMRSLFYPTPMITAPTILVHM